MAKDTDAVACKIINLAKATALADNHFLAAAIGRLKLEPGAFARPLATDGEILGVNSQKLCQQFKQERAVPKHDLMHSVLHCIFLHPFVSSSIHRREWNLACDIASEQNVLRLCGPRPGTKGAKIRDVLNKISLRVASPLTAEKIYRELLSGTWTDNLASWEDLFISDDHGLWYNTFRHSDQITPATQSPTPSEQQPLTDMPQGECQRKLHTPPVDSNTSDNGAPSVESHLEQSSPSQATNDPARLKGDLPGYQAETMAGARNPFNLQAISAARQAERRTWKRIAKAISINLQTYAKNKGGVLSGMVDELEETAHDCIDYLDFLRQFAIPGEVLKTSEDEFDYIFYTYGLKLYGNMPLIEPLEYRVEKRIREFVIVIDTSGSVCGPIVRRFIGATFNILKSTEAFFEHIHLRIIQCDAAVQCDDIISSRDELRQWGSRMRIYGCGGTDFRPAFAYVDTLVEEGAFKNLDGLIYFTDGMGDYPEWTPSYKVAFVFYDKTYQPGLVPPWAAQIVLSDASIPDSRL